MEQFTKTLAIVVRVVKHDIIDGTWTCARPLRKQR